MPEIRTTITMLLCAVCGWQWRPQGDKLPAVCPRCKSYKWNEEKEDDDD